MFERTTYDALVIGARCAGAATAMLMARSGLRVLAIDRGEYGADALSTHALMRAGVLQLSLGCAAEGRGSRDAIPANRHLSLWQQSR